MRSEKSIVAKRIHVGGIVQGVGFRPFVYRLAVEEGLGGWVRNESDGVWIHLEGPAEGLDTFGERLRRELPPLARIDGLEESAAEPEGFGEFRILSSDAGRGKTTPVSPDMNLCDACRAEMRDPTDRRYGYPFINCTDCGPRYTIVRTVPYDRPNTSMAAFEMCPKCRAEYEDPLSRRYHAQPISCPECGPSLSLWLKESEQSTMNNEQFRYASLRDASFLKIGEGRERSSELIDETVRLLGEGKIVALKGLGGFHLLCDATNAEAVAELRRRKRRPSKPFALMVKDLQTARNLAEIDEAEERLLLSKERPIVLLKKTTRYPLSTTHSSDLIAPRIDRIGLMLPYTPLHELLFERLDIPLVATSANLSDEPIIRSGAELRTKLGEVVDAVLDHDREILNACDDSVAQIVGDRVQWLRVARGVAPLTLPLPREGEGGEGILAVGAQQKNTIALSPGENAVVSPHIGDLATIEAMEYFERTVKSFERFYDFSPHTIVHDLHPGYETSKWAREAKMKNVASEKTASGVEHSGGRERKRPFHGLGSPLSHSTPEAHRYFSEGSNEKLKTLSVQHHYAHALAVMAEHGYRGKALAFVWDGTGYGEDGTIWGGEVFRCDLHGYERIASLRPFRLLGGERAVREPRRVALALLFELYSLEELMSRKLPTLEAFSETEIRLLHRSWERGFNAPVTSSMGRLFDGVASLAGLCQRVGYEGESGLLLETLASSNSEESGAASPSDAFLLRKEEGFVTIDWEPLVRSIVEGSCADPAGELISGLAGVVEELSALHPELPVILTGGVFQNRTLMEACLRLPCAGRFLLPERLPPNDGAISLGQLWKATHY